MSSSPLSRIYFILTWLLRLASCRHEHPHQAIPVIHALQDILPKNNALVLNEHAIAIDTIKESSVIRLDGSPPESTVTDLDESRGTVISQGIELVTYAGVHNRQALDNESTAVHGRETTLSPEEENDRRLAWIIAGYVVLVLAVIGACVVFCCLCRPIRAICGRICPCC
ncbi:uncharacterized protein LOC126282074 [Schistocerca gregaria]|uniref:uncharacterized protein LOC126282074 n=1 Tax=Schistocerca gregaria TaxID=7010 RepID=UPI00211E9AB1|nr:uncharacterized protein LOC126282074 [Schistocerca gregaria]